MSMNQVENSFEIQRPNHSMNQLIEEDGEVQQNINQQNVEREDQQKMELFHVETAIQQILRIQAIPQDFSLDQLEKIQEKVIKSSLNEDQIKIVLKRIQFKINYFLTIKQFEKKTQRLSSSINNIENHLQPSTPICLKIFRWIVFINILVCGILGGVVIFEPHNTQLAKASGIILIIAAVFQYALQILKQHCYEKYQRLPIQNEN